MENDADELQNVLAKIAGQRFRFLVSLLWGLCISLFIGSIFMAFSQADMVKRATEAGVLAYLVKPVQESNLFPAIEVALSRYQEMHELEDELFKVKDTLAMRKTLDRAKGILMDAHGYTESEAFKKIQQYSMAKRKTIKEVAEAIIRAATK